MNTPSAVSFSAKPPLSPKQMREAEEWIFHLQERVKLLENEGITSPRAIEYLFSRLLPQLSEGFTKLDIAVQVATAPQMAAQMQHLRALTLPALSQLTPLRQVEILIYHSNMRLLPDAEWLQGWANASAENLDRYSPYELSKALSYYAKLSMKPDDAWLLQWQKRIENSNGAVVKSFSPRAFSRCLYALAVEHVMGSCQSKPLAQALVHYAGAGQFSKMPDLTHQNALANRMLDLRLLADKDIAPLHALMRKNSSSARARPTMLERRVKQVLMALTPEGVSLDGECYHKPTFSHVDMVARKDAERYLIQVDGPHHFYTTPEGEKTTDASTLLQNAIIAKFRATNQHLVRVSYDEIIARGDEALSQLMIEKMDAALAQDRAQDSAAPKATVLVRTIAESAAVARTAVR